VNSILWKNLFLRAVEWRQEKEQRLVGADEIGRLFAGKSDGLEGVLVDAFGPLVVLTIYNPTLASLAPELLLQLKTSLTGDRFVLGKVRSATGGFDYLDPDKVLGRSWTAREDDCLFEVRADDKNDFGLFPDARPARLALRQILKSDSHVLNLFSYTCGFGVVALRSGARAATNVDASPEMLTWGKRNAGLNGVDFAVVPEMAQKYLQRLERRVREGKVPCPDVWVCDPPAFGVGRGQQRILKHFWTDFWGFVDRLSPRAVLVLRNDRTGHRQRDTFATEVEEIFGARFEILPVGFAQSPSLCYEDSDSYYKVNESLILLRR
jgi:23S rRNA (cytosine1962-C5)-methyltransferase